MTSVWGGFLRTALATALYAAVHSAFASRAAKSSAAKMFGPRNRNGLYRPFYLAQSLVTMLVLIRYIRRQPGRMLYRFSGISAVPFHLVQMAGITWAIAAAYQVGMLQLTGLSPLASLLRGDTDVSPEPEAQGPALRSGNLHVAGPFRYSRHPLNLVPLTILWAHPRQTTRLLAYNLVSTLYLLLGSANEERRLTSAYGDLYRDYQSSGVPFYLPR